MNKHVPDFIAERVHLRKRKPKKLPPKLQPKIELVRKIENIDAKKCFSEIEFTTEELGVGKITVPRSDITHPENVQRRLLDGNVHLYFSEKEALKEIKEALRKPPRHGMIKETARTGWHNNSFVWEGGTHGDCRDSLRLRVDENSSLVELSAGSLPAWKSGLEKPCECSSFLVFVLALGFAAPFLRSVSPNEGATFYIWGKTTTGKTLAKRALMSIFRRANENDLMTFDHTVTKLDEEAEAYNDLVLVLNESERLKKNHNARAEVMHDIAYKIAGGVGRQTSQAARHNNPDLKNRKWLVFCIASGETTAKTADRNEGEEIRLVDIPVPKSSAGGIFSRHRKNVAEADRVAVGTEMAKLTEKTILENYGVAFAPFMDEVCADLDATVERVKGNVALFMKKMAPEANAKISRLVEKFGIVYAGAIEACKVRVAPWTEERARTAIEHICRLALERIAQDSSVDTAIENLCASFEREQQFPVIEKGNSLPPGAADQATGFRRSEKRQYVAVTHEQLEKMIGEKVLTEKVLNRLVAKGIIWMDGDKRVRKVQVSGFGDANRARWYCFWYDELFSMRSSKMTPKGRT